MYKNPTEMILVLLFSSSVFEIILLSDKKENIFISNYFTFSDLN
jgi:hypothetical protein